MAHLSRSKAPKNWPIKRKETKWISRPRPGAHPLSRSISINLILKKMLKYADTTREVRYIINEKTISIDKKNVRDPKFAVGFMDIIDIPQTKESYRVIINEEGEFELVPLKKELDSLKPCKIIGKTILKGAKIQLNLSDGRNMIAEKGETYRVGDTLVIDISKNKITEHLKLDKGSEVFLSGGKHRGLRGKIVDIILEKNTIRDRILVKTKKGEFETLKEYAFAIDNKFLEK